MIPAFHHGSIVRKLTIVLAGSLLYGTLNTLMSGWLLPGADIIAIRPQLIIPVAASLLAGPFTGGLIGLLGNFFGDFLSGYGSQFWHWSIANFLIGFVPGTLHWMGIRGIARVNEFALVLLFIFLGNVMGLFEGFLVHILMNENVGFLDVMYSFYLPALIANTYLLMLLMPPLLVFAKFLKMNIETRSMFFVLLFSLVVVTILSLVFIAVEYGLFSTASGDMSENMDLLQQIIIKEFRWIGIMLLIIVASGGFIGYYFSRKYMQPINRLAQASDKLKEGSWQNADTVETAMAAGDMENLIGVFNDMAREILTREMKLKNTINELKLEIDKVKEDRMVEEITETDFFRQLEKKSAELRKKK